MGLPGMPNFEGLTGHAHDAIHHLAVLADAAGNAVIYLSRIANALEEQNEINKDIKDLFNGPSIMDAPKAAPLVASEYTGEALRRHYPGLSDGI